MATRKKKTQVIESADIAEMANVDSGGWPKIQQGTHLTVITHKDGKTELKWDWDALVGEVRAACLKAESILPVDIKPTVKAKVITRKKKEKV
jgi:hypothetical protein